MGRLTCSKCSAYWPNANIFYNMPSQAWPYYSVAFQTFKISSQSFVFYQSDNGAFNFMAEVSPACKQTWASRVLSQFYFLSLDIICIVHPTGCQAPSMCLRKIQAYVLCNCCVSIIKNWHCHIKQVTLLQFRQTHQTIKSLKSGISLNINILEYSRF